MPRETLTELRRRQWLAEMTASYDATLRHDLAQNLIDVADNRAPCGTCEVVDAGVDFLIVKMVCEFGVNFPARYAAGRDSVITTFVRDLRRAVTRARWGGIPMNARDLGPAPAPR